MTQSVDFFNELKTRIIGFIAPTMTISVKDFKSAQEAVEAGRILKTYMSDLEKRRKELVQPLNDELDRINAYAKSIKEPMLKAETHIKAQITGFEADQERRRKEAFRIAEEVRKARELSEAIERAKVAAELETKRQAEIKALEAEHQAAASVFGAEDPEVLAAEKQRIVAEHEAQRIELEIKAEQDQAIARADAKAKEYEIAQMGVKNMRKTWKCEITDIELVPKEFLIRELNNAAVLAAARGGFTNIPGVKVWQESSVAFSRNTYVPREALGSEET